MGRAWKPKLWRGYYFAPVYKGQLYNLATGRVRQTHTPSGTAGHTWQKNASLTSKSSHLNLRCGATTGAAFAAARTLVNNCVEGVTKGHSKTLELQGVGYRVQLQGKDLLFNIGYSHQVSIKAQQGIIFEVVIDEKARTQRVVVSGIDKAKVGQMAADIRKVRKPDPYKGKGIRYLGEIVKTRAGKRAAAVVKAK
jgi:ribosomal protein L6P/L9E